MKTQRACVAALAIAAILSGCQAPPAAPVHPQVLATRAASGPASLQPPRRFLATSDWSFSVTDHACTARTAIPEIAFSITVGPSKSVTLTMDAHGRFRAAPRGGAPAAFGFSGAGGSWQVRGRADGQAIEASWPLGDQSLDDVLALLSGGQLAARTVDGSMPGLDLPDAGVAGRDWLACPRGRLAGPAQAEQTPPPRRPT